MKKYENVNLPRVFNISGGLTSAYMVIKYYKPGDLVIFCDTSREHPKTYKFLNDFEAFEGIPIIRLKWKGMENTFDSLLCSKKYKVIPNRMKRICTVELKINTQKAYLRSIGILSFENFIGFRSDEKRRVLASRANQKFKKVHNKFPLYDDNINKAVVVDYWKNKPYSLEIPSILGNCTLCFMKGKNAIITILSVYPELAEPWINDETNSKLLYNPNARTYFKDCTIEDLLNASRSNLFKDFDINTIAPAFNCACTP